MADADLRPPGDLGRALFSEGADALRLRNEAIHASITGIVIADMERRVTYANPAFLRMWGFETVDEVLGRDYTALTESPEQTEAIAADIVSRGGWVGEVVGRRKSGGRFAAMVSGTLLKDASGVPFAMMGSVIDVSDRRRAEEALRDSEERYRSLVESAQDLIFISDIDGRYLYANVTAAAMLGTTPEHVIGKTVDELFSPEVAARYRAGVRHVIETGESLSSQDRNVINGRVFWLNALVQPVRDRQGRVTAAQAIVRDITGLKLAEEALRESEERLRQAVRVASIGIFDHDHRAGTMYWSPQQREIWGWGADEPVLAPGSVSDGIHQLVVDLIHPDDRERVEAAVARAHAARDGSFEVEHRIVRRDGELRWVIVRSQTLFEGEGDRRQAVRTIGAVRDITERKQAEHERAHLQAQLAQAQKMELVGRLAGGVAHDFNNMLNVVIGNLELAAAQIGRDHPARADLAEAEQAARRSTDLTRQLLGFARRQTVQPRALNPNDYIAGSLKLLRRIIGEDIELSWVPGAGLGLVEIDPSQVDQILTNLSANARDAIPGVGRIAIRTSQVVLDAAYCAKHPGSRPGPYVVIEVADDGCGMDEETLAHIYEPFYTTKADGTGTGLGLATVYGIVTQNNGFMSVVSQPGRGTTVQIFLPCVAARAVQAGVEAKRAQPTGTETLLLVEDEPAVLRLSAKLLERLGYTVLSAGTPIDAIQLLREHRGDIQLLVTDMVMPGMNGRELARQLTDLSPGLKCLFVSGYFSHGIMSDSGIEAGVHFLQKPFSVHDLATKVRDALDS